jgi:hypothetical protein
MTIEEQEAYLLSKLTVLYEDEKLYRKALARVRSKVKIEVSDDFERPDLIYLKDEKV